MPKYLDTNIFIRFFTGDNKKQANEVASLIKNAKKNEYELLDTVVAEIVWVLLSFYELPKEEVIEKLEGILLLEKIKINRDVLEKTLSVYRSNNISYIDAYIAANSMLEKGEVVSFDKGFDKVEGLKRIEP